jgi:hypothetical protein
MNIADLAIVTAKLKTLSNKNSQVASPAASVTSPLSVREEEDSGLENDDDIADYS